MTNVVAERYLAAPPDAVWSTLTSEQALEQWFWPPHFATVVRADLREGGQYRIASPVAGMAVSGRYGRIHAPKLLDFGWQWDGEELISAVAIELIPRDAGTGLVLTHSGLADFRARQPRAGLVRLP